MNAINGSLFGDVTTADLLRVYKRLPPMIVDSFAGGGGASTGIEMALGRSPDIAINHNPAALALHAANHPKTLHLSENVYRVDPLDYLRGRHIGLMHFSPDCKHFSKAKGGKPVERNIRDLAWIIPGWIERIQKSGGKVDVVTMENVEEWKDWGPLVETEKGLMPCPERRGQTFEAWCKAIRKLGGKIEWRELRACDYGAPTIRKRLFVVIRFDGEDIVWPEPTHGDPKSDDVREGRKLPWRTAAEIIDWSLPCPSIFDSSEQIMAKLGLRAVRPLADNTMARVARGMKRYVLDADRPFIVNLTHGGRGEDAAEPLRTITGANRGEKAVVSPQLMSMKGSARRIRGFDEPHPTILAEGTHSAVVAPHLMTMRNSGKPFNGADEPTHTITAGGAGLSIVAPVLTYAQQGGNCRSIEEPHQTITASQKDQNAVIIPTLVQTGYGERPGQFPRAIDPHKPLGTIVAGAAKHAVATAFIAQQNNDSRRVGGVNPGRSADDPISTVTATGAQQAPVAAFIARQFGASVGHGIDEPSATITAGVNKSALVAPYFQKYFGTGDGSREDAPAHTITVKDRFGHVEAALDAPPFTPDQADRAREVAAFLRSHGFWDEREFVTLEISGVTFVIVDIGMRMLTPRELYNAQGFPTDYVIDGGWEGEGDERYWVDFPKSVQVSCVGNSVSPPPYAAIVAANCQHLMVQREAAE